MRCFGPLEPVYDWDELATVVTRARIAAGPRSLWRYADLLPAAPPDDAANGPGLTPLVAAPRLARALGIGEILLKLDLANPTHSFKDRVVAVAAAKATEFGLETLAATSTGNLANAVAARAAATGRAAVIFCPAGLEAEKLRGDHGLRGDRLRRARQLRRLQPPRQRGRGRGRLGDRQRQPALVLRRGLEDARVRDLSSSWTGRRPTPSCSRSARARCSPRSGRASSSSAGSGLIHGDRPRLFGGQAEGCAPVASAFAEQRRVSPVRPASIVSSIAIGNPADGDLAIATAETSGGSIYAVPEDEIGPNISLLAETAGVFGEGATAVAIGALREAVMRGELGERDRVVVIVSGTGLKTPQLARPSGEVLEIEPDADALLEQMGVTA